MKHFIFTLLFAALLHSTFFIHHSYAFKLPDTGQSKCYQAVSPYAEIPCAGTGQDGANSINPMSFTDNGNGTVTDNNTGLIWQKCSVGQNNDATCSGTAVAYNWYQASGTYDASNNTATLNVCGNLALAGGGWRLPSIQELTDIFDYSIPDPGPTIQQTWFPKTVASNYWASNIYVPFTDSAWYVNFYDGSVSDGYYFDEPNSYVRCVRDGQSLVISKTGTGTGTITSSPSGISCGATCSASFTTGTVVSLIATPDSGSSFAGWSGACSGTGTCTVAMSATQNVTATFTLTPQPPSPSINWSHQGDGKIYGMTTDGNTVTGGSQFYQETNQAWSIVGQGDFDGDGIRDLVWWNNSTGQVYIMLMASPTAVKSGAILYTESDTHWRIAATGDINGDGKADLIWWNSATGQVYAMLVNGTTVTQGGIIYTEPDTDWKIVAAADFNGNGTVELLWWNSTTGQVALGQTNGTSASSANLIWLEPDTNWRIAGAGDLDGDGKADIIWHNRTTGQVYGMQTNGSSVTNGALMYTEADTLWEIVSVGNYNGDNKAELLWWNQQTGQVYLMPMNGLNVVGGALLYTEPDLTWKIQGETEWRDKIYGRGVTTTTK
ncbi:MAG: FG-GAP-like repeat-containing protein [Desulfuromonadales bacterium]